MTGKSSVDDFNSRYVQGGLTDVFPNRLGWWERRTFASHPTDKEFVIPAEYHQRPDKLAYDIYGRTDYYFFLLQRNNIIDIFDEFVTGKTIFLPTPTRMSLEFMSKQPGGNKRT